MIICHYLIMLCILCYYIKRKRIHLACILDYFVQFKNYYYLWYVFLLDKISFPESLNWLFFNLLARIADR